MRRGALDRLHDLRKRVNAAAEFIHQRHADQVHVVGHHDAEFQFIARAMVMNAGIKNDGPRCGRKDPSQVRAEGNEVELIVALKMGEVPAVEVIAGPA